MVLDLVYHTENPVLVPLLTFDSPTAKSHTLRWKNSRLGMLAIHPLSEDRKLTILLQDGIEEIVARHFAPWGEIARTRVLTGRGVAFVTCELSQS